MPKDPSTVASVQRSYVACSKLCFSRGQWKMMRGSCRLSLSLAAHPNREYLRVPFWLFFDKRWLYLLSTLSRTRDRPPNPNGFLAPLLLELEVLPLLLESVTLEVLLISLLIADLGAASAYGCFRMTNAFRQSGRLLLPPLSFCSIILNNFLVFYN